MVALNTFSITARCEETGQLGIAVSTKVPAVGMLCPFAKAGVGAVSTQAFVNPYLGIWGVELLTGGSTAEQVKQALLSRDPDPPKRQFAVVDSQGHAAAYTGSEAEGWCGHIIGANFAVAGNMLVNEDTITAMASAFRDTHEKPLAERLLSSLQAGQDAGGDKRGRQSAALKIMHTEEYPYLDLRADDNPQPVSELQRIYQVAQRDLLPILSRVPTKYGIETGEPS